MKNIRELAGGSKITTLSLFGFIFFSMLSANNTGWFRLFGGGITWTHHTNPPIFSERIGKRKKITIGDYRYGFLKPNI